MLKLPYDSMHKSVATLAPSCKTARHNVTNLHDLIVASCRCTRCEIGNTAHDGA